MYVITYWPKQKEITLIRFDCIVCRNKQYFKSIGIQAKLHLPIAYDGIQ